MPSNSNRADGTRSPVRKGGEVYLAATNMV